MVPHVFRQTTREKPSSVKTMDRYTQKFWRPIQKCKCFFAMYFSFGKNCGFLNVFTLLFGFIDKIKHVWKSCIMNCIGTKSRFKTCKSPCRHTCHQLPPRSGESPERRRQHWTTGLGWHARRPERRTCETE